MCKRSVGFQPKRLGAGWAKYIGFCAILALGLVPRQASAQTPADKATARQLATQGIQLFQQGKHAEALDLLQRAEQLYDAPVHLIYIARTQAALGKLVEASETYRKLVRTDLPAGAPEAFKGAVADGQKELQQLEPRIPSLRIDVVPADTQGLQLKVDGEVVSTVVIGINRPTNPGKHSVEAAAANFDTATASVELASGGKQTVTLQMRSKPGAPAPVGTSPGATPTPNTGNRVEGNGPVAVEPPISVPENKFFDTPPQVVLGLKGVFANAGGKIGLGGTDAQSQLINGNATEGNLHDRMTFGGGLEVALGFRMRIGSKFALVPKLAAQYFWLKAGSYYNLPIGQVILGYDHANDVTGSTVLSGIQPHGNMWKVGASLEFPRATKPWSPTYYAELMLIVSSQLALKGDVTTGATKCTMSDKYSGNGASLGLGVYLPVAKFLRLSPGVNFSGLAGNSRNYSDTCPHSDGTKGRNTSLDLSTANAVYTITELTLGGEFLLGI